MKPLAFSIPLRTVSGANAREHPMARHRRVKAEREAAGWSFRGIALMAAVRHPGIFKAPITVRLTRVAPSTLDSHDNLASAMKATVDQLAEELGLKSDRDPRVTWEYAQVRRGKEWAVDVEITEVA